LQKLHLKGNLLQVLPAKLDALAKIENIDISHNPLMKPLEVVASDNLIDPIGRYLNRAELRSESLLHHMMELVALRCPIDEFHRITMKMRLNPEDSIKVTSDKTLVEHEQLSKLLKLWRKKTHMSCTGCTEAADPSGRSCRSQRFGAQSESNANVLDSFAVVNDVPAIITVFVLWDKVKRAVLHFHSIS